MNLTAQEMIAAGQGCVISFAFLALVGALVWKGPQAMKDRSNARLEELKFKAEEAEKIREFQSQEAAYFRTFMADWAKDDRTARHNNANTVSASQVHLLEMHTASVDKLAMAIHELRIASANICRFTDGDRKVG